MRVLSCLGIIDQFDQKCGDWCIGINRLATADYEEQTNKGARPLDGLGTVLFLSALGCLSFFLIDGQSNWPTLYLAIGLLSLLICRLCYRFLAAHWQARYLRNISALIAGDPNSRFILDREARVMLRNPQALEDGFRAEILTADLRLRAMEGEETLADLLLRSRTEDRAKDTLVMRDGATEIEVSQLRRNMFSCTLRNLPRDKREQNNRAEVPDLPMLTSASNGTILFLNHAARSFLGARPTRVEDLFSEPPTVSDVNLVKTKQGMRPCFLFENTLSGDRREIFLVPSISRAKNGADLSFEDLPVAVLKIDKTGKILAKNRTALDLIGPLADGSHHLSDVMEGLGRPLSDWLREAAEGRAQHLDEFLRLKRDDRESYVQVTLGCAYEKGEAVLYAVFHDATELKTLEAQFVQSQKMQAIGQLAGGIAHDFNNLLTAIAGHCDLLLLRHDHDNPEFADLMQIHQNANRAAALVGQLLAFSRKQTLQPATTDLRECLADLSHLLKRLVSDDINLIVTHGENLDSVYLDAQQFEQVIINLVVNARDAMPAGGDVVISADNVQLKKPLVKERATVPPGDYVRVEVRDQGAGISEDKKQKVFEPFYTTKRTGEGTGLGLSTAYGIVKQSGGFIFLVSEVGVGTTFTLLFPKSAKCAPIFVRNTKEPVQKDRFEGTILLVEDEAPVRAFASRALRLKGFSVLEAACGEDALEILEDKNLQIDLFLTDVAMPGMDGPTWVRKALKERLDTRVVFISGYAEEKFSEDSSHVPNAIFLPKPFSLEELTSTVHRHISEPSGDTVV